MECLGYKTQHGPSIVGKGNFTSLRAIRESCYGAGGELLGIIQLLFGAESLGNSMLYCDKCRLLGQLIRVSNKFITHELN